MTSIGDGGDGNPSSLLYGNGQSKQATKDPAQQSTPSETQPGRAPRARQLARFLGTSRPWSVGHPLLCARRLNDGLLGTEEINKLAAKEDHGKQSVLGNRQLKVNDKTYELPEASLETKRMALQVRPVDLVYFGVFSLERADERTLDPGGALSAMVEHYPQPPLSYAQAVYNASLGHTDSQHNGASRAYWADRDVLRVVMLLGDALDAEPAFRHARNLGDELRALLGEPFAFTGFCTVPRVVGRLGSMPTEIVFEVVGDKSTAPFPHNRAVRAIACCGDVRLGGKLLEKMGDTELGKQPLADLKPPSQH